MQNYGKFVGFPVNSALFGLVIYSNAHCNHAMAAKLPTISGRGEVNYTSIDPKQLRQYQ